MLGTVTIMYMYNVDTYLFDLFFMPYSRMFSLTSIQRPAVLWWEESRFSPGENLQPTKIDPMDT